MVETLQAQIWYDKSDKKFHVEYKDEKSEYAELNDLLTFIGKKLLIVKHNAEFTYNNQLFI